MLDVYLKVTLISEAVPRGVLKKVFYEHVAAPMQKCDFNKVVYQVGSYMPYVYNRTLEQGVKCIQS